MGNVSEHYLVFNLFLSCEKAGHVGLTSVPQRGKLCLEITWMTGDSCNISARTAKKPSVSLLGSLRKVGQTRTWNTGWTTLLGLTDPMWSLQLSLESIAKAWKPGGSWASTRRAEVILHSLVFWCWVGGRGGDRSGKTFLFQNEKKSPAHFYEHASCPSCSESPALWVTVALRKGTPKPSDRGALTGPCLIWSEMSWHLSSAVTLPFLRSNDISCSALTFPPPTIPSPFFFF